MPCSKVFVLLQTPRRMQCSQTSLWLSHKVGTKSGVLCEEQCHIQFQAIDNTVWPLPQEQN